MAAEQIDIEKASAEVQDFLAKLDVEIVGVTSIDDLKRTKLEESALRLLPAVKSIVVLAKEVYPEFLDLTSPERTMGTANMNDLLRGHIEYLRGRLTAAANDVAKVSRRAGLKALPLAAYGPAVDARTLEGVISYRHAAEAAGIGQIGMSSLLVTQQFGPRVNFSVCLIEAVLKPTPKSEPACRYCNICVSKCPSGALGWPKNGERYVINVFACRTYGDAAGGCSECMKQCPVASPKYA